MKRILLISPNLEPGKCGVSDYTIVLRSYLQKAGYSVYCLALSDKFINIFSYNHCEARVPFSYSYKKKKNSLTRVLNECKPERIIIQYVPHGYQPKGLPYWLLGCVPLLKKIQVDWILHELWIEGKTWNNFSWQLLGFLQKRLLLKLLSIFPQAKIATTSALTVQILDRYNIKAGWANVFCNITDNPLSHAVPSELVEVINKRDSVNVISFGNIIPNAKSEDIISFLSSLQKIFYRINVIAIGDKEMLDNSIWPELSVLAPSNVSFLTTNRLPTAAIAWLLLGSDIGISTYPYDLWTKSGGIAAMLAHKLPVITFGKLANIKSDTLMTPEYPTLYKWKLLEPLKEFKKSVLLTPVDYNDECYQLLAAKLCF